MHVAFTGHTDAALLADRCQEDLWSHVEGTHEVADGVIRVIGCRHIVEFKGVGCMEPHSPETMASTLFIVQEFMSGNTLKVLSYCRHRLTA